jgi:hypothetical protein
MDEGEKRLYTPLVLRTGFMHSYRRTIPLLLLVILLEALFWTWAGFWPRYSELGLLRWGLIVILAIVVPIGTSIIRDIVAGYAGLFGLFDAETEKRMRLYRSLDRPSSETEGDMQGLFKDVDTYSAFQKGIRQIVSDKTTDIVVVVTILSVSAFVLYNTVNEKVILRAGTPNYPQLILELFIDAYATIFLIAALSFILMFGIGYFLTLSRLGRSESDLSIWNYVQYLRGNPIKDGALASYWRFHDYASAIGGHFSGVAFRIVLLMAIGGLGQILYNVSTSITVTWFLAAIPVALSVLILVLPLYSLHRVIDGAKSAVLRESEKAYERLTLGFMTRLAEQAQPERAGGAEGAADGYAVQLLSLKGIIEETRGLSTWPVGAPAVVRIVFTALIPLGYFFLEEFLRELWLG